MNTLRSLCGVMALATFVPDVAAALRAQDQRIAVRVRGGSRDAGSVVVVCAPRPSVLVTLPEQQPFRVTAANSEDVSVEVGALPECQHVVYAFATTGARALVTREAVTWAGGTVELQFDTAYVPPAELACKNLDKWLQAGDLRLLATLRDGVVWAKVLRKEFDGVIPPLPSGAVLTLLSPVGQVLADSRIASPGATVPAVTMQIEAPRTTTAVAVAGKRKRAGLFNLGQWVVKFDSACPARVVALTRFLAGPGLRSDESGVLSFPIAVDGSHAPATFQFTTDDGIVNCVSNSVNWSPGYKSRNSYVVGPEIGSDKKDVIVPMLEEEALEVNLASLPVGDPKNAIPLCRGSFLGSLDGSFATAWRPIRGRSQDGDSIAFRGMMRGTQFVVTCLPSNGVAVVGAEVVAGFGVAGVDTVNAASSTVSTLDIEVPPDVDQDADMVGFLAPKEWWRPQIGHVFLCRAGQQPIRLPPDRDFNVWVFAGSGHSGFTELRSGSGEPARLLIAPDRKVVVRMTSVDGTALAGTHFSLRPEGSGLERFWPSRDRIVSDSSGTVEAMVPAAIARVEWRWSQSFDVKVIATPSPDAPPTNLVWTPISQRR